MNQTLRIKNKESISSNQSNQIQADQQRPNTSGLNAQPQKQKEKALNVDLTEVKV